MNDRPFKWTARLAASAVAVSLMATPMVASAAPTLKSQPKQVPQSQRKAYAAGKKAFDAGDFARAGDEWAAVLSSVDEERANQGTRMRLVLDTIASYREAYAIDGDVAHLEAAMDSYYGYFKAYKDAYGSPAIPRPVVEARHQLKDELDQAKSNGGGAAAAGGSSGDSGGGSGSDSSGSGDTTTSSDGDSDSTQPTTHSAEGSSGSTGGSDTGGSSAGTSVSVSTAGASGGDRSGAGTPLIAAGAAAMAVGVGSSSLIVVGAIEGQRARTDQKLPGYTDEQRDAIDKRGRQMNALFIAGLVTAPVLVGAGAALVAVGVKKRRSASRMASVAPMLGGSVAGVTISGRF